MNISIQAASNRELYIVTSTVWDDEDGYTDRIDVVDADELGNLLLQLMPYQPKRKQQPKQPNNVRSFPFS